MKSWRFYKDKLLPVVLIGGLFVFLWVLYFWRLFTPTAEDRSILHPGDFTLHYFNFTTYQAERLWESEIPLWNPYNYAGEPLAANIQRAAWYPVRWLAIVLAGEDGWDLQSHELEVAAHYLLAICFTFAFLRVVIGRTLPALVGGILFTYGGYLTAYPMLQVSLLETSIWLPVLLLGLHLSVARPGWRVHGITLAGAGLCMAILAGHPQGVFQMSGLALAYLVFMGRQHGIGWRWIGLRVAGFVAIGMGLAAIQVLPAIEYVRLSSRATELGYRFNANGFAFADFLQLLWPHLGEWSPMYVGVAGLLLGLGAMLRPKPSHLFWTAVALISLWWSFGGNSIVYDVFYVFIPGADLFRQQERVIFLFSFALSVLAACQVDWLLYRDANEADEGDEKRFDWLVRGGLALSVAVLLNSAFNSVDSDTALINRLAFVALIAGLFTAWLYWQRHSATVRWQAAGALMALIVVDLFTVGTQNGNFVPDAPENEIVMPARVELLQATSDEAVWRVDGAAGVGGYGTYFHIQDIYGAGPLALDAITDLYQMPVDRFWEILAVRYVTLIDPPPDEVEMALLASDLNSDGQEYRLYEINDPRPFAHLVYDYRYGFNPQFSREIMSDPRVNLREIAVTLEPLPFELPGSRPAESSVTLDIERPERLRMRVSTSENTLLTVPIPNVPGWEATVNGRKVEIINTYAGLIGIPLRAGENQRVRLEYHPASLQRGGIISGVTLAGSLLVSMVMLVLGRRSENKSPLEPNVTLDQ